MVCWWTIVNKDFGWVEKTAGRIRMGQKQRKKKLENGRQDFCQLQRLYVF